MTENTDAVDLMSGFHRLGRHTRVERVGALSDLSETEMEILSGVNPVNPNLAENFIENVIGYFPIPLGMATYFRIDGRDLFIPMAVEETSIIAAASASAKWIRQNGSIKTYAKGRLIIGQIQIPGVRNVGRARKILHENRNDLIRQANALAPGFVKRGGGVRDIAIRELAHTPESSEDQMLVLHVLCDPCDAMGANMINQICEGLKPAIESLTRERVGMCILSNLVDSRLAGAEVIIRDVDPSVGHGIEDATEFAKADPYRATTHNKGTLNGIDAVLVATGNDWRAVEAGVHAYANRSGKYQPVTDWKMIGSDLVGHIEVPLSVGTVGGMTRSHPLAQVCLKVLGVQTAEELARVCAAVGLVQNLGALKALSTVGIVKGHMKLHAANLAIAAGADIHEMGALKDRLHRVLKTEKCINLTRAKEILASIRNEEQNSTQPTM